MLLLLFEYIYKLRLLSLESSMGQKQKIQMYKSTEEEQADINAVFQQVVVSSFFRTIQREEFQETSKIHFKEIIEKNNEDVDEQSFILSRTFQRPHEQDVNTKSTKCFTGEEKGAFCCFSSKVSITNTQKKVYELTLKDKRIWVRDKNELYFYVDLQLTNAFIKVLGDTKILKFRFQNSQVEKSVSLSTKEQTQEWMKILSEILASCKNQYKKQNDYLLSIPKYYRQEYVLNEEFQKFANTGDIILFRSQHSAARLQRLFTDSQYDHVGIVLRNSKNQIVIFQSSSNQGVGITFWKHVVKYEWYLAVQKICWRRLNINLKQESIDIVEAFVAKSLGKKFGLTLSKIFKDNSSLVRTKKQEEEKTYFCSELVARLYKELELLPPEKASSQYYPVNFSEKGQLRLIKPNVSLSNEKILVFKKNK